MVLRTSQVTLKSKGGATTLRSLYANADMVGARTFVHVWPISRYTWWKQPQWFSHSRSHCFAVRWVVSDDEDGKKIMPELTSNESFVWECQHVAQMPYEPAGYLHAPYIMVQKAILRCQMQSAFRCKTHLKASAIARWRYDTWWWPFEAAHENEPRLAVPSCHGRAYELLNTQIPK